jgi:hypothetical protein
MTTKKPSGDKTNQAIAKGIAVSASAAIARAKHYRQPLVVWRNGKIAEVNAPAAARISKESKPKK